MVDVTTMLLAYRPEAELDYVVDPIELQEPDKLSAPYIEPEFRRIMSNRSLLAIAVEWGHDEIILALLRHKAKSSHPELGLSMIVAARNGYEGTIRVFLDYGRATNGYLDPAIISELLVQQSIREASRNGHLHISRVLLEQCRVDDEQSHCICIAICEARMHGYHEIVGDLRALALTLDSPHLIGNELVMIASARPAYDSRSRSCRSNTPYLSTLLDEMSSERMDSNLYVSFQLKALKGALKAGQYEAARFLLEKDTSCCILKTETEFLHFAIRNMWINDFNTRLRDTRVLGDLFKILIKHGAPTGSYDSLGNTPLFYAC